ncbi:MAG: CGGC domain-containing protein [Moorella humiferrea]|nr:CGGC domain-containing protein [Moorella humiferrea]
MLRVGIITCGDYWKKGCPGHQAHVLCFLAVEKKEGPLGSLPGAKIVSFEPCPGCPGDARLEIARRMIRRDKVDCFVFPTCMFLANHCPTAKAAAKTIEKELGRPVLLGSYLEAEEARRYSTVILKPDHVPSLNECRRLLLNLNYLRLLCERKTAPASDKMSLTSFLKAI